jgi:hypothetical protein
VAKEALRHGPENGQVHLALANVQLQLLHGLANAQLRRVPLNGSPRQLP